MTSITNYVGGKNSAPSDKDKGSIRPVNRRGQTPKQTETAIRPSKSRNLAGPSTKNSFQSTRRLRGYKNLVKINTRDRATTR